MITVTTPVPTLRSADPQSRCSRKAAPKTAGVSLTPAARPMSIPRKRAGTTKRSMATAAARRKFTCPRWKVRTTGSNRNASTATQAISIGVQCSRRPKTATSTR